MGTGLGHISEKYLQSIHERVRDGMKVMSATQCLNGTVNLDIYTTGRKMKEAGILSCRNMLPETAYVKMMHVLGNYPWEAFESVMQTNLRGEFLEREQVEVTF
jgi:L-asparaginase/archaeal Glu-tRNAGln amidotransferase subunit D